MHYHKPRHCLGIWAKICDVAHEINFKFQWLIGIGDSVNVYSDPWISMLPISMWPTYLNINEFCTNTTVNQLVEDRTWNFNRLQALFDVDMTKLILHMPISVGLWPDQLAWGLTKLPQISLKDIANLFSSTQGAKSKFTYA